MSDQSTDELRGPDASVLTSARVADHLPRLVVPEGWLIDEAATDRMMRQLDRASPSVAGIVAEVGALAPGASHRVHAEWKSLEALSAVVEDVTTSVRGAVLLRPGAEFHVDGDIVEVGAAPLLVDAGAHVHDPWGPVGPLRTASELGRPPFPRRPVVVFIGIERDPELADWARRLTNRLVRRDVEARLALPELVEGLHLTRPCLPTVDSIRALAPDVIVALDDRAAALVPGWCGTDRSTVVIELDRDTSTTTELVSWQVGRSSGRLRARIGRRVDAPGLAELVRRLCAGPHPLPPSGSVATESRVVFRNGNGRITRARTGRTHLRTAVVVTGNREGAASRRIEGLCDHLAPAGVAVTVEDLERKTSASARDADLVILAGVNDAQHVDELVRARRDAGRATVVDVGPGDLELRASSATAPPALTQPAAELANACRMATAPAEAVRTALRNLGVRSHALPTLLTRARVAALREARTSDSFDAPSERVLGLCVGTAGTPEPASVDAVADALSSVLAERPEVRVEVVGDRERVPRALTGLQGVSIASRELAPDLLGRWSVYVWTPPLVASEVADDLGALAEASCAGVPSIVPASGRAAIDGHVPPDLVVERAERPEDWIAALQVLLDDEQRRTQRSREVLRHAGTLYGALASKSAVERFLGWIWWEGAA